MSRRIAQLAAVLVLSLGLVVAVAAQDQGTPTPGGNCATPLPGASPAAGATAPAMAGTPCATPGASNQLTVEMIDINFNPKELTIPANTDVVINLVNKGATTHNFTVEELGISSGDYSAGQTGTVTINAPAGTYRYVCTIPGHEPAGMVGTLTVQ